MKRNTTKVLVGVAVAWSLSLGIMGHALKEEQGKVGVLNSQVEDLAIQQTQSEDDILELKSIIADLKESKEVVDNELIKTTDKLIDAQEEKKKRDLHIETLKKENESLKSDLQAKAELKKKNALVASNKSTNSDAPKVTQTSSKTPPKTTNAKGKKMTVEATAYSTNQPSLSDFTFTGVNLRKNPHVIAVDPNVIPLGSKVSIPGYGTYIAADTGGDIKGNRIDVHITNLNKAISFGRKTMEITIVN